MLARFDSSRGRALLRVALSATLSLLLLVVTAAPASASSTFDDEFSGSSIDSTLWNTDVATSGARFCNDSPESDTGVWVDISSDPSCHGLLVSPPYASVTEGGGVASFAAPTGSAFGYVVAGPPSRHPFPSAGDFVLELRMRYDATNLAGDGVTVTTSTADPVGTKPFTGSMFQVWNDLSGGHVNLLGNDVAIADASAFHDYRLEYTGGAYSVFVDGAQVLGPIASVIRPTTMFLGHPEAVWWAPSPWTAFSVDFIRVTAPADTVAPVSTVGFSPSSPSGSNGWYVGPVVMTVSATDDSSGVAETRCVVDPVTAPVSFDQLPPACDSGVTVSANGHHLVYAASKDNAGNAEIPIVKGFYIDRNPPVTRVGLVPAVPQGSGGWYTTPVKVHVSATDGANGSHVAETRCVLDPATAPTRFGDMPTGCRFLTQTTVSAQGRHALYEASRDRAGNVEKPTRVSFKIDRPPPPRRGTATRPRRAPPAPRLVTVTAAVQVTDAVSGPDRFALSSITSNQSDSGLGAGDQPNDIQGWTTTTNDLAGKLRAEAYISTRTYTLTYQAHDTAGNTQTCTTPINVPLTQADGTPNIFNGMRIGDPPVLTS